MNRESNALDGLKGIAIVLVTLIHTGGGGPLPDPLNTLAKNGQYGVQLFFVISSLLSCRSLENYFMSRDEYSPKRIICWIAKKYFRLAPMFYLAICISMITDSWSPYWLGIEGRVTIWNVLSHIFFIHGLFPHYTDSILAVEWYLGVLFLFYLVVPFIYLEFPGGLLTATIFPDISISYQQTQEP